jgi:hypothetical protein
MPSKYGFSTEERDSRRQAERTRRSEAGSKSISERRQIETLFVAPRVIPEREAIKARERRRSKLLTLVYQIADDFKQATEVELEINKVDLELADSGKDSITIHVDKDQWYKLPSVSQEQLMFTIARHTKASCGVVAGTWSPISYSLFGQ